MRHEGVKWKEAAEKRLAGRLLVVSKGQVPAAAAAILDIDMAEIPELDPSDAGFERRRELRIRTRRENEQNALRRKMIILNDWTDLYTVVATACEDNAPMLACEMQESCNMEVTVGHTSADTGEQLTCDANAT